MGADDQYRPGFVGCFAGLFLFIPASGLSPAVECDLSLLSAIPARLADDHWPLRRCPGLQHIGRTLLGFGARQPLSAFALFGKNLRPTGAWNTAAGANPHILLRRG